ncbi:MAG TPA: DNA-protecting protein DprA [Phycisphaerales bacterium]|nr:MAG: DNA protecting protein DprA [Planctomycetes bacterium GWC2_45_44]HBG78877.1 DNA-protecting protein DprA [Phycisphaerales bacterium]HBR19156.1 DNA-protecting protein DprA [Phycisphaerales bacterium]
MQENSENIRNWLRLVRCNGVGPTIFMRLLKHFGTVDAVLNASATGLEKVDGVGPKTAEQILRTKNNFDIDKEIELAEKFDTAIINLEDERYPTLLKKIYDPPPVLYVKGDLVASDSLAVAIVGSRGCSHYGSEQASRFAHLLAAAGFTIVSGMARGIDSAAHTGALSAGGRTIAVQGCGLSRIFPPENKSLFEKISQSGACISELPMGYEPLAENFPARNRIIAGLCLATIVIEAMPRSGALLTAKAALENDREVMAVPGRVDSPLSKGPHSLIKQGARLVESVDDVIETLEFLKKEFADYVAVSAAQTVKNVEMPLFDFSQLKLTEDERKIFDCLDGEPVHVEQIIAETGIPAGKVNATLVALRLKGIIKNLPGNFFCKKVMNNE